MSQALTNYHPWMFKEKEWVRFPAAPPWALLAYHVVTQKETRATPEQIRYFDYTFACMMQRETGAH